MKPLVNTTCPTGRACWGAGWRLWTTPSGEHRAAQCRRCTYTIGIGRPLTPVEARYIHEMTHVPRGGRP